MASFTGKEEQVESEQAFDILPIIGQRRNQLKVLPQSLGIGARDQTLRKSFGHHQAMRHLVDRFEQGDSGHFLPETAVQKLRQSPDCPLIPYTKMLASTKIKLLSGRLSSADAAILRTDPQGQRLRRPISIL